MTTVTIDTHAAIEALRSREFTKKQAEGIVETIQRVEFHNVATKADLLGLENRIFKWMFGLYLGVYGMLFGFLFKLLTT